MKVEDDGGDFREKSWEKRKKTRSAGEHHTEHSIGESRKDDEISDEREEGEGAEIKNQNWRTDKTGGEASKEHAGEPGRRFAAVETLGKARGEDENGEKGGEGELPAKVEEVTGIN